MSDRTVSSGEARCPGCGTAGRIGSACMSCGLDVACVPDLPTFDESQSFGSIASSTPDSEPGASDVRQIDSVLGDPAFRERFEVRKQLGRGAFGTVFSATELALERPVALKLLMNAGTTEIVRFQREAQMLARLDHPNVMRIHGIERYAGTLVLVLELLDGQTLGSALHAQGRFAVARAVEVLAQILSGVAAAHALGIVHRDLKPSNVLLVAGGGLKVLDFGLARDVDRPAATRMTATGAMVGTPQYMSPEQCRGHQCGPAADVYSAGIILFEMLAGRTPFTGDYPAELMAMHIREEPPRLRSLLPDVPSGLDELVHRSLRKETAERYPDGTSMLGALRSEQPPDVTPIVAVPMKPAAITAASTEARPFPPAPSHSPG